MSGEGQEKNCNNNKRKSQNAIKIDRPKRECRSREILTLGVDSKWTTQEKEKLLEALHRHSPSAVESISQVVGSRTAKEVEEFIEKIMNSSCLEYSKRKVELDPEKGAAPLELWLSLVQELISEDKKVDHSAHYSKVLRVIARNESLPEDSGFASLNWKNLYQYVCDLLDDKAVLQPLTNMESLVMLDMMHSLGDTLHSTDTQEQRKMLDLKYQLFRWQAANNGGGQFTAGLKALNNDFTDLEYTTSSKQSETLSEITTTTATATTPSSSSEIQLTSSSSSNTQFIPGQGSNPGSSQPIYLLPIMPSQPQTLSANSTAEMSINQAATKLTSPSPQSLSLCTKTGSNSLANTTTIVSTATTISSKIKIDSRNSTASNVTTPHDLSTFSPIASTNTTARVSTSTVPSSTETFSTSTCTTQPHRNLTVQGEATPSTHASTAAILSKVDNSSTDTSKASISKGGDITVTASSKVKTSSSKKQKESFKLPDLFSLNPFNIPSHLLPLKSKDDCKEEKQIPVLIDIQ